ncbi:MAG TPA: serine/threonine-protein kinase [Polyangiaceae bacterium]|nr:serine/threonine-protein kinase [Polyangiaceae bacterium]
MNAPVNAPVKEGEILAGKYRVDRILGVGGMGVVVAAHHIHLDDKVAIKFLLPEMLQNTEAVARFAREARAAVRIKSEHVARVTDVGTLENGAPYMVMEYLDGGDLTTWLKRGGMGVEQAVDFVLQACEAIAEAHTLGIVHRDLKPANLFVIRLADGTFSVKVLDFGISKVGGGLSAAGSEMTRTSAMMGSPLYMSPEQMQSAKDVDARSDIWALGIILYELLTAESPFVADTIPELVVKILSQPPPPIRNKRPDLPPALESAILKCLEKDRANRYQSVGELALALVEFGPRRAKASVERISGILRVAGISQGLNALPPSSEGPESEAPGRGTAASWGKTTAGAKSNRTAVFLGATGILIFVTAVVVKKLGAADATAPSATAPVSAGVAPEPQKPAEPDRPSASSTPAVAPIPEPPAATGAPAAKPVAQAPGARPHAPVPSGKKPPAVPAPAPKPTAAQPPAAPAPKKNCDPNYYLDAQGEKHFKPECF